MIHTIYIYILNACYIFFSYTLKFVVGWGSQLETGEWTGVVGTVARGVSKPNYTKHKNLDPYNHKGYVIL